MLAAISGAIASAAPAVIRRMAWVDSSSRLARGPEQQQERVVVVGHPLEVGQKALLGLLAAAGHPRRGLGDRRQQPVADLVEQRHVQILLGVEVLVEHRFGDPGGFGDVVHRGAMEAVSGEHLDRDVEDLFAAGGSGKSDAHTCYLRVTSTAPSVEMSCYRPRSRSSRSAALTA